MVMPAINVAAATGKANGGMGGCLVMRGMLKAIRHACQSGKPSAH